MNHDTEKSEADLIKEEYAAFGDENPTRSKERKELLDQEIAKLCAQGNAGNVINLVTQFNYVDGFYDKYTDAHQDL